MRTVRAALGLSTCLLVLLACSSGEDGATAEQAAAALTAAQTKVAGRLWEVRLEAVALADGDGLAAVEAGLALTVGRAYYVTYLAPKGIEVLKPRTIAAPRVVARGSGSFLALAEANWSVNHALPSMISTLFRVDGSEGQARISIVFDRIGAAFPAPSGVAELAAVPAVGRRLLGEVAKLRDYAGEHGELPTDRVFVDNRFTTGYVEGLKTFKDPEPWEVSTSERTLGPATDTVGFSVAPAQGQLSCGVVERDTTTRHRDGALIRPSPVLGDAAFLVEDGDYSAFTEHDDETVCVMQPAGGRPEIVSVRATRTAMHGVK